MASCIATRAVASATSCSGRVSAGASGSCASSTLPTELRVPLRRTLSSRALGASPSGGGDPRRGIPRSARRSHASAAAPASSQGSLGRGAQQSVKSTLAPEAAISADALAGTAAVETLEKTSTEENAGQLVAPASDDVADQQVARRSFPSGVEIFPAEEAADFEVAAELRATAFYEDLEARQALPFPPRFIATFRREFAQRERRALKERTAQPSGPSRRCLCLMSRLRSSGALVGCLDVSVRTGPCASQVNGACVGEGEEYVYVDNVAVDVGARRKGAASAMLEASSDVAIRWGAGFIYTHVHVENIAARRLYHAYGFRAPKGAPIDEAMGPGKSAQWASPRLAGLVLLRAPLPLMQAASEKAAAAVGDCTCGAVFDECDECVCHPAKKD